MLLLTQGWSFASVPAALGLLAVLVSQWLGSGDGDIMDLAGKNVWITGAGSGIGEALVRKRVAEGKYAAAYPRRRVRRRVPAAAAPAAAAAAEEEE